MRQALALARRGEGWVEPNPMVGCVIARDAEAVGVGWHQRYGGPHAEVEALAVAGERARGATMYVTLEPCCHQGKTPPCTQAIIAAGVSHVVLAVADPFPQVSGGGIQQLRAAGIEVTTGVCEAGARCVLAPYLMLTEHGRPWVIAKWAMTLDGRIATRTGDSKWISSAESRQLVHQLRGRVDGIVVGRGTAEADDPQLLARREDAGLPATSADQNDWPPRRAVRIILDSQGSLSLTSHLVRSAGQAPVLVATAPTAPPDRLSHLKAAGCEVLTIAGDSLANRVQNLLAELGRRRMTNLLVEGGSQVLGSFWQPGLVDEVHVFIAPRILGSGEAPGPFAGAGPEQIHQALGLANVAWRQAGGDFYVSGRVAK